MEAIQAFSSYELERGKPMPSRNHALLQIYLGAAFLRYEKKYSVLSELSLDLPGAKHTPDLCVYPKLPTDWQHDQIKMTEPPLLVVEILSPKQSMSDLIDKAESYLAAGVKSCWIVQPTIEAISVLLPGEKPKTHLDGEIMDPDTRITIRVDEIFK